MKFDSLDFCTLLVKCVADSGHKGTPSILEDGSIIIWDDADFGGDSSAVGDQLRGVQQIQAKGSLGLCP